MCLDKVTRKFKPNDKMRVGYKIFQLLSDNLFQGQFYNNESPYELGKYYKATDEKIDIYDPYKFQNRSFYDSGFHCFTYKKDAIEEMDSTPNLYVVIKVLAWDIRATGDQYGQRCFIAKNIRLMEVVKSSYQKPENPKNGDPIFDPKLKGCIKKLKKIFWLTVKRKDTKKAFDLFMELTTESYEKYIDFLCILDRFERYSKWFKVFTTHHISAMSKGLQIKNTDLRVKRYIKYYNKAIYEAKTNPSFAFGRTYERYNQRLIAL